MAVTADKVVTVLEVQDQQWMARIGQDLTFFQKSVQDMLGSAQKAGKATSVVFDQVSGSFSRAGKGAGQAGRDIKTIGDESKMAQQQVRNLAFQFQDIGTMLASGQSPFMLLAQQLPQVTMYGGSLNGVIGALRSSVAGLISPIGLATTAFVLLGSAAFEYLTRTGPEVRTLDQVLKDHKALIDEIKGAYGEAALAAKGYAASSAQELGVRLEASVQEMRVRLKGALNELLKGDAIGFTTRSLEFPFLPNKEFEAFRDQVLRLWNEGEPALSSIREEIARIGEEQGIEVQAAKLLSILDPLFQLDQQIQTGSEGISAYAVAVGELGNLIDSINSARAQSELKKLAEEAIEGGKSVDEVKIALGGISGYAPDLSGAISEFLRLIGVARQAKAEIVGFSGKASTGGPARYQPHAVTLPDVGPVPEERGTPELSGFPFEDFGKKKRRGGGGSKRENEYQRLTQQIEARTKALDAETEAQAKLNPLVDDYGYAAEKAKIEAQLLNAAEQAKVKITPDVQKAIEATAEGFAAASAAAKQLAEDQREVQRVAEEFRDMGANALGGFIRDLREGKSATEALANALDKVADKFLDMAMGGLFGGNGGGGGFLGNLFGGLFGGGFNPAGKVGLFASGTANTGGARGKPMGVVHGQEAVIPLPMGGKVPVQLSAPNFAGYSSAATPEVRFVEVPYIAETVVSDNGEMISRFRRISDEQINAAGPKIVGQSVAAVGKRARTTKSYLGG